MAAAGRPGDGTLLKRSTGTQLTSALTATATRGCVPHSNSVTTSPAPTPRAIAWLRLWKHRMHDALAGFDAIVTPRLPAFHHSFRRWWTTTPCFCRNQLILRNTMG